MPVSAYDRYFGGHAAEALQAMIKTYGPSKGRRVFYATLNQRRKR
jgi:hypothetical protein